MMLQIRSLFPLALIGATLVVPSLSLAQDTRLVTVEVLNGWDEADGRRMAGLRIQVADGWKTYWRAPGDAGVPPQFDWSGSSNVASVQVHWPRPDVFDSFGQTTLGYTGEVVLPLEIAPEDPALPMSLSGSADIGVCADVCIAVHETVVSLPDDGSAAIRASLAARPTLREAGTTVCRVEPILDGMRLTATLDMPSLGEDEVTVVELMRDDVWISAPEMDRQGSALTTMVEIVPPEAKPFALDPATVRITVLGEKGAAEAMGCAIS